MNLRLNREQNCTSKKGQGHRGAVPYARERIFMKRIVNSQEMKALDRNTIEHHQIPSLVLMERAALAVVQELQSFDLTNTLVVCGSGNNGGDGIAVARILHLAGQLTDQKVSVFFAGNPDHMSDDCRKQTIIARSYGVTFVNNPIYSEYTTIVDAIFGVGLSRTVEGSYKTVIEKINSAGKTVVAVDIPSGINADDGAIMGCAVKADLTVTFAFAKVGHLLFPGKAYTGHLKVHDIGIYDQGYENFSEERFLFEKEDLRLIPLRKADGNKGTFGKVLIVAGSEGMAGAAILCGKAAMRSGCGMVKIITHESNRLIIQQTLPESMLGTYTTWEDALDELKKGLAWATVAAVGPGIGVNPISEKMVSHFIENGEIPLVLDADALNILSRTPDLLYQKKSSCFLTPHIGEMSRLTGQTIQEIKEHLIDTAKCFSQKYKVHCVLKDAVTCTAVPENKIYLNHFGNSGMATAGSGDVLTGILAGLLGVHTPEEYCGALGVLIHSLAGDGAKEKYGESFLTASDLIEELQYMRLGER